MSLIKRAGRFSRLVSVGGPTAQRLRLASTKSDFVSESNAYPTPGLPHSPSTQYLKPIYTLPSQSGTVSTGTSQVDSPAPSVNAATAHPPELQAALDRADKYQLPVYARPPLVLSHGKGLYVWDTEGRKYLDFSAGIAVNALGHADEQFIKAMTDAASKILHASNVFHNEWAGKLAELLVTLTQSEGGLGFAPGSAPASGPGAKVFFANSGTEANEGALKIARKVGKDRGTDKIEIVCFANGFHGRSMGALSVTATPKYQEPFLPLIPGVRVGRLNSMEDLADATAPAQTGSDIWEGQGTNAGLINERTCAVIVEPVQGEGGCTAAEEVWLRALRKKCDDVGAVLIFDEVQCGLYRTGSLWAHSVLPVDCHPDIVTMAKPLANGYPIGAVLMKDSVAGTMTTGTHGTTFGGSPLACALGHHVLSRLCARPFVAHIAETAAYLSGRLERLPTWFPEVLQPEIRGRGLIRGLAFKDAGAPAQVVSMARERGVLLLTAGKDAVRLVPSLTVSKEDVDVAVDVIEGCLASLRG